MAGFNNDTVFADNLNFSGGTSPSMTQDGQLLIGDSGGNPTISTLISGTGMTIGNAPGSITVTLSTPVAIANGGTGGSSFTQGSVLFMGAAALSQDNANFFWDDTNNALGLGTTTPIHTLEVQGHVGIIQAATATDQHAFEITADAANFADFKALDITYDTGSIANGDFQAVILVNVDETASTGGQNIAFNVDTTTVGSATIIGLKTGIGINAIHQETGTFGDIDNILNIAVDVTAALASGGAGNISAFVADNDTMTLGDAAQWDELEVIITTGASGAGIAPTFEFSTGGTGFSSFGPIDGTNGFRNTGIIDWEAADLSGWIANATGFFEIRITRTRNNLSTTPIIDMCQLTSETEHIWDSSGDVNINSLVLATPLAVAQGGAGRVSSTAFSVICGGTSSTAAHQSIASVGTSGQLLTSNGAGALPTFQASASLPFAWNEVTGTSQAGAVNNGYVTNNVGLVTVTLPSTAAFGDIVSVVGKGSGGWRVAQNAGQSIRLSGGGTTTVGVTGRLDSTGTDDTVEILCETANSGWIVISSLGTITVT